MGNFIVIRNIIAKETMEKKENWGRRKRGRGEDIIILNTYAANSGISDFIFFFKKSMLLQLKTLMQQFPPRSKDSFHPPRKLFKTRSKLFK